MQKATSSGLVSAPSDELRYTIACVHGAPVALQASLVEEWSTCTAQVAHKKLNVAPTSYVTNQNDKDMQLRQTCLSSTRSEGDGRGSPRAGQRRPHHNAPAAGLEGGGEEVMDG